MEEEIDLKEFFNYYLARIGYVAIAILVFLILGSFYSLVLKTPMYQSSTTIILTTEGEVSQKYTQNDFLLNKNLVSTYSNVIKSHSVLKQLISNMNLDYTNKELSDLITVSMIDDTEIIKIIVKNKDKYLARDIANDIIPIFSDKVKGLYNIDNVSVLDVAELEDRPCNMNYLKDFCIYIMLGFVLASSIIFIIYYFDTTIKSPADIEDKLKLTVLGTVPTIKG